MKRWTVLARTALALGPRNVARALAYRVGVKTGWNGVRRLRAAPPRGPFFPGGHAAPTALAANPEWEHSASLFGAHRFRLAGTAPEWFVDPISRRRFPDPTRPWWTIPDFDPSFGDIKPIWELSRLDWTLPLAQRGRNGNAEALDTLNHWLSDWSLQNPPYCGPNWKCGQEASIRVMHLAATWMVLGYTDLSLAPPGLADLLATHLRRIAPTISYAVAQDNNHATSEAAALFIGGHWLQILGHREARRWSKLGRYWLENRVRNLISEDGSFSQHSLNYHRLMLDTLSLAEAWRRRWDAPAFSATFSERARKACDWLAAMIDPGNGDGPNLGANDGARLIPLTGTPYRDFRPSLHLGTTLFHARPAFSQGGPWDAVPAWLGLSPATEAAPAPAGSGQFDNGGYAVLKQGEARALVRYPRFRFRPSHADALHVDFWLGSRNLLRDAGSYSYNSAEVDTAYFAGTASHNTVQFDDRDQMPRLSRFLFGAWLQTAGLQPLRETSERVTFAAGYRDHRGAAHHRSVTLEPGRLQITDRLSGSFRRATLRWRLPPGKWTFEGSEVVGEGLRFAVSSTSPVLSQRIVDGWESRHYLERNALPVFELVVSEPAELHSTFHWTS